MTRHIAFISEPLEQLDPKTNTTWALMQTAQEKGYRLFWMETTDIHIKDGVPVGYLAPLELQTSGKPSFALGDSFLAPMHRFDLIWWRKSPPYSADDLLLLDALQMVTAHTPVLNTPGSLRLNEQLYPLQFPEFLPPTLVTKKIKAIQAFLSEIGGKAVIRSLLPSQTHQQFFLRMGDPNLNTLLGMLTHHETQSVIVQKLVTEPGLDGDKRIFLLDGAFLGIVLQIPAIGELRGSFERGAEPAPAQPSDKDLRLAQTLGQRLREDGIFFATADVSDGLIVDINLHCPSGLAQLQTLTSDDITSAIFSRLAKRLDEVER